MQVHEGDFDEEWEQCLFKIVWLKGWQRNVQLMKSRVCYRNKDKILSESDARNSKNKMEDCLRMTAVTAVSSTDEGIFSRVLMTARRVKRHQTELTTGLDSPDYERIKDSFRFRI